MARKTSLGRQKIKIAKIEKANHRQVTFSKRRSGLFKKACELCTLCGIEILIIVFSPAQKVFSFGHPDVDSLVDRFFSRRHYPSASSHSDLNASALQRNSNIRELNAQLTHIENFLEEEKNRGESLDQLRESRKSTWCWWESAFDKMKQHELEQLCLSMEELKKNVANQASKMLMEGLSSIGLGVRNDFGMGIINEQFESKPTYVVGVGASSSASAPPPPPPPPGYNNNNFGHGQGFGIF
ncbi:hypothetical protein Ancab_027898 [Ancistrocladus abbreviatus]